MMRKVAFVSALAVSALAAAAPASAQWAPPPPPGAVIGAPFGNAYGYDNRGQVRRLEVRVQQLRERIRWLDRQNRLSNGEARRLDRHAVDLQRRIQRAAYRGLDRRERYDLERRIDALNAAIRYESRDGGRWGWSGDNRNDNSFGYYGERRRDDDHRDRRDRDGDRDDD